MKSLETRIRFIIGINMCFRWGGGYPSHFPKIVFKPIQLVSLRGTKFHALNLSEI